jgi:hypothetical protein
VVNQSTVMDRSNPDCHRKRDRHREKPVATKATNPVILSDSDPESLLPVPPMDQAVADESFDHDECVFKLNRGNRHASAKWIRHVVASFRIDDSVVEAGLHDIRQQLVRLMAPKCHPPLSKPRPDTKRQYKSSSVTAAVTNTVAVPPVLPVSPTKDQLKLERAIARMKNEILKDTYDAI